MSKNSIDSKYFRLRYLVQITVKILLAIICVSTANADEVKITVGSASAKPGDHLAVTVSGSVNVDSLSSIQMVFEYNAGRLKIDSVSGGLDYALKCTKPDTSDSTYATLGTLKISCSDVQNITDGNICILYVTCLSGEGNEALITPAKVVINDTNQEGNFVAGKITFDDTSVTQKFIEGLGYVSPNPFGSNIKIPYTIDEPTNAEFLIYDLSGRLITEYPPIKRTRGSYFFYFSPDEGVLANGAYYLVMKTDSKVYTSYFIRMR
ncbi:MAG: T9SS type A sorting domain-containing protein [Ignavibacteriae bacterium]|nr:T9SS type A sorting domain-containing protein [Ignavibacteriota bacterium]